MNNKIKRIISTSTHKLIKVRLDYQTFVTISRMSSLKVWLKKYPEAKIV